MSSSERQRRFLDRLRGAKADARSSLLQAKNAALKEEVTTLRRLLAGAEARVRALEARRERPRRGAARVIGDSELEKKNAALRRKNAELRRRLSAIIEAPKNPLHEAG